MNVEMLDGGWLTAPASLLRAGGSAEESIRFPVPAFLVETASERILIDTGLNPAAVADPAGLYGDPPGLAFFGLEQELSVADQLDLSTLTKVVLTHLHFDHVGALHLIPAHVPVVVQRSEWAAAHDPADIERNFYLPRDYAETGHRVELVDGDHDLLGDGSIRLLWTPGHTRGHQSVQVGDLVIGADVVHFASGLDDHRFPVFGDDRAAQGRSAERLKALRDSGCTVLPGHDPAILRPGRVTAAPAAPAARAHPAPPQHLSAS
jgi:glyoxylase-like metal-dependent hydrolase (beta-lactamase superfamily II)